MGRSRGTLTLRREDGRIVCESVRVADKTFRRMRGLLGRRGLRADEGLVLRPAWSIHTAFMRFPIDVVFLDHDQVVVRLDHGLRPFRTASCRGAREVVELAAGECERRGLEVGDRVAWAPRAETRRAGSVATTITDDRRGSVLVASRDARFLKLARFLIEGRGLSVVQSVAPAQVAETIGSTRADVVLLDAQRELADGLRTVAAARALRPELPVVLVGEDLADRRAVGMVLYDKWAETDAALDAVERAIDGGDGDAPPLAGSA